LAFVQLIAHYAFCRFWNGAPLLRGPALEMQLYSLMDDSKMPGKRHRAEEIVTKLRAGGRHAVCEEPTIDAITLFRR
jgi:hypothetical protein